MQTIKNILFDKIVVESEIITEAFSSKFLQRLAKQIHNNAVKTNSLEDAYISKWFTFKKFAGEYGDIVEWSKITDDNIQFYDAEDFNSMKNQIRKICKGDTDQCIFLYDEEDSTQITKFISNTGAIKYVANGRNIRYDMYSWKEWKISDKVDLVKRSSGFVIVDISNAKNRVVLKNQRYQTRKGMIEMGNVEQYKKIAEENRKRYQDIINKRRAGKLDPQILTDIEDVMKKALHVASKMSDPKYLDKYYEISSIIRDQRNLLSSFESYMDMKHNMTKDRDYSWYDPMKAAKDLELKETDLKNMITELNRHIKDLGL